MNDKLLILSLFSVALLAGCTSKGANTNPSGGESSSQSGSSGQQETRSYTVSFIDFTNNPAVDYSLETHNAELVNYCNTQESGFFTSIDVVSCYSQASGNPHLTLCIGTGKYDGSITFNCKYDIVAIDFKVQGYYKVNSGSYNVDMYSEVTVEGTKYEYHNVSTSSAIIPPEHNEHLDLTTAKKSVNFSNDAGAKRVYLNELTITYLA